VRRAFNKHFVHDDGTIEGGTQTSYVLALQFDLLPKKLRERAAAELIRNVQDRNNHLRTGFVGTPYIIWVLKKMGHLDTAYALLKQTTWPSWLYSVTQGAITIWERWDGWTHDKGFQDPAMNSFNHYAYGAIGDWMYAVIGGIDLDPEQPGYQHIIMHPQPGGGLTHAHVELQSMYGMIRSAWTQQNGRFDWQVTVPPNTTATVYVPARDQSLIIENGQPAENAKGVAFLRMENGFAVLDIASGNYSFSSGLA
jgi:alpha-L-rhamnosidase